MNKKRIILGVIFLMLILFSHLALAEEKSHFDGVVTFTLPSTWEIQDTTNRANFQSILLFIPCKALNSSRLFANATIVTQKNPERISVKEFGDWKLQGNFKGVVILEDYIEGKNWRSVFWRAQSEDTPFAIMDRFGVSDNFRVHMRVAFPIVKETSGEWLSNTIDEINALIKSLKIDGHNSFSNLLKDENGSIWLK